eukprot:gb/GEZN01012736.1/.p1 GENE.gb/GEZN01012736.1/~~gb/GEZN01012736.1/.p1  ORF type:complete len:244 (+),score=21.53 gb/GEZN01012736.1/:90-734(+)
MEWTSQAYSKLMLHVCSYPSRPVFGVLLGSTDQKSTLHVVESVPLFHSHALAAQTEAALLQVSVYCAKRNLVIVGVYTANEFYSNKSIGPMVQKVAARVAQHSAHGSIVCVVDNSKIDKLLEGQTALEVYRWNESRRCVMDESTPLTGVPNEVLKSVAKTLGNPKTKRWVRDFEDHLNDISVDWLHDSSNIVDVAKSHKASAETTVRHRQIPSE